MQHGYSYAATLTVAQKINWKIEDILDAGQGLDFSRPFMPEALVRANALPFLDAAERIRLNHIRAHGYLYTFGMVEEFILPFLMDHVRATLDGDDLRTRALLQFASEEAKHIDLFKRFRAAFLDGFGTECAVIGPPEAIAGAVLAKAPLSVALLILQVEWMTQRHYLDSVRDDAALDPQFASLLKHHWVEEAQHAKLDTLMVERLAAGMDRGSIDAAIDGYLELGALFDGGMKEQAAFDLDALARATGRAFDAAQRAAYVERQHQALRWTFIGSGMSHPNFLATVDAIAPGAAARLEALASHFA